MTKELDVIQANGEGMSWAWLLAEKQIELATV